MGSKAEYEAKKAAKLAKRAADEAARWQAVLESCKRKDTAAPAGDDEKIRLGDSSDAEMDHTIGFCVTAEPGRIIAEDDWDPYEDDGDDVLVRTRSAVQLDVGEVVHACLYKEAEKNALRCVERVLYPRIILPDGWQETISLDETEWADEDAELSEAFGAPVGELIYGP